MRVGWADGVCEKLAVPPGSKAVCHWFEVLTDALLGGVRDQYWGKSCLTRSPCRGWYSVHPQQVFSWSPGQAGEISWRRGGRQSEQACQAAGVGQWEPCVGQQRQGQSPGCGTDYPHRTLQAENQLAWKQPSRKGPGHPGGQKKFLIGFQHLQDGITHTPSRYQLCVQHWWGHTAYTLSSLGTPSSAEAAQVGGAGAHDVWGSGFGHSRI